MISRIQLQYYYVVAILLLFICCCIPGFTQAMALPVTINLQYVENSGLPVNMSFKHAKGRYSVETDINMLLYSMKFVSTGHVVDNKLIPESYRDYRSGQIYAQALFDKGMVSYGKTGAEIQQKQITGSVYDVFTLAWQLALNDGKLPKSTYFTNGKRIYPLSGIDYLGQNTYVWNHEDRLINQYRIEQGKNTIDYAFMPSLDNIPVQISYTDRGHTYILKLNKIQLDGKVIQAQ